MKVVVVSVITLIALTGCAKKAQQSAADAALSTSASQTSDSGKSSASAQVGTQAPSNMPSELVATGAKISASTTVADGYQSTFTISQTPDQLTTYYKGLNGWTVKAEFATDATKTISLEKSDQTVVITMNAKGSDSAEVVVTGSFVKSN